MVAKRVVEGALVVQTSLSDLNRNSELLLELVGEVSTSTYMTTQEAKGSGHTPKALTKQDVSAV